LVQGLLVEPHGRTVLGPGHVLQVAPLDVGERPLLIEAGAVEDPNPRGLPRIRRL
jgi:hypothetical protein